MREIHRLKDDGKFEPWLWGVARNVTKAFRRSMGKQHAMYSYDTLEYLPYEDEYGNENEELYNALRAKISMLSKLYRDIIILYYYDGLSTKQISEKLNIPEGTVTWRLSQARRKLKKECTDMNETALRPKKLIIRINGEGNYNGHAIPFPHVYIEDALSQNILYYCYDSAKTVEDLSKLCGVPAYYIEDSLQNLLYREAIKETVKGKYRTDFIIYSDKVNEYDKKASAIFKPIVKPVVSALKTLANDAAKLGIYTAEKSKDELIYLYGIMAMEHLSKKYNPVKQTYPPVRYDGWRWSFIAHLATENESSARGNGFGREESSNRDSDGTYMHISYTFGGFKYRRMMYDNEINVCEDILINRKITDTESAAAAIQNGFISRNNNGKLTVMTPAFTKDQYSLFTELVEKAFAPIIESYMHAVAEYVEGYKKLFPAHLEDDVARACHGAFVRLFATEIFRDATDEGLFLPPENSVCDVLIQHK